jgi:hypothetical protein
MKLYGICWRRTGKQLSAKAALVGALSPRSLTSRHCERREAQVRQLPCQSLSAPPPPACLPDRVNYFEVHQSAMDHKTHGTEEPRERSAQDILLRRQLIRKPPGNATHKEEKGPEPVQEGHPIVCRADFGAAQGRQDPLPPRVRALCREKIRPKHKADAADEERELDEPLLDRFWRAGLRGQRDLRCATDHKDDRSKVLDEHAVVRDPLRLEVLWPEGRAEFGARPLPAPLLPRCKGVGVVDVGTLDESQVAARYEDHGTDLQGRGGVRGSKGPRGARGQGYDEGCEKSCTEHGKSEHWARGCVNV